MKLTSPILKRKEIITNTFIQNFPMEVGWHLAWHATQLLATQKQTTPILKRKKIINSTRLNLILTKQIL